MSDFADTGNPISQPMNSLAPTVRALYLQQYNSWKAAVASLTTLYNNLVANPIDTYEFRSGDGSEKVTRKDLSKVGNELEFATNRMMYYHRKLYGRGIISMRTRRK